MSRRGLTLAMGTVMVLASCTTGGRAEHPPGEARPSASTATEEQISNALANLPLSFVENRGQTSEPVDYLAQGARYGFYLTEESVAMSLFAEDGRQGVNLFLDFVGSNPEVTLDAARPAPGTVNYLKGDVDSTSLPTFGEVVYDELWPGVDMSVRGLDGVLKYEFRVQPGANLDDIRLAYRGASGLELDDEGRLLVDTNIGALHDAAPVSYQLIGGQQVAVESGFTLDDGDQAYGFAVGEHDPTRELVIDPGLSYATFLGGSGSQVPAAIAVDSEGSAYITGYTQSPDFPTTPGAYDRSGSAQNSLDAFVSKLNPTGTALVYSTFLGGSNFEWGRDIAIDANGNAYVTGQTESSNFPTTSNAFDRSINRPGDCPRCGIGLDDAFVAKLNASGSGLVYSTFLGGGDFDDGMVIAVDGSGQAHVAGQTLSDNFPTRSGSFDRTDNGNFEIFVTKFNASGSGLVYSTYLGGSDLEAPSDITVDSSGNGVVVGWTDSTEFPITADALRSTQDGGEGFLTRLNPSGSDLVYSSFLGGSGSDSVGEIELDGSDNIYLAGFSSSPDFPTTPGTLDPDGSGSFVAKLNPAASGFIWSTFVPGTSAIAVDSDGSVWLAGSTSSPTAFVTPDAWDPQLAGSASDVYLAKLDPAGANLVYATYFGGAGHDSAFDVALDPDGNVYFTGRTRSEDFPVTDGAVDRTFGANPFLAGWDGFVAMFEVGPGAPTPPPPPPPIPGPPTLLTPADEGSVIPPATFDWEDVEGAASYEFQIDEISAFGLPLIVSEEVAGSEFTATDLPAGDWSWFWRVRALNSEGTPGPWSEVRAFTKHDTPPPPGPEAPSLVSPADGAQVTSLPILFDWTTVEGAASYRVEFDDEPTFSAPIISDHFSPGSSTLINLLDGQVFWRVRAFNSAGVAGSYSAVRSLQVDTSSPTPTTTTTTLPPPPTTTTTAPPPPPTTTTTQPPSGPLPSPSMISPSDDDEFNPGSTITFDWGNVSGAASYTIQIDDDDDFGSPFTLQRTVGVSQTMVSGLPEERFWWRVRANDSNETPGNWSSERRFELKD